MYIVCIMYIYISGLLKVREAGKRLPSHLAKVAARNHKSGCENHKVAARIINWLQDLVYTPAEVVSALRASVKVAVGSQPLFDFSEGLIYVFTHKSGYRGGE